MNRFPLAGALRLLFLTILSLTLPLRTSAQRFAVGTNAVDWMSLGTVNADAGVAVSQHATLHVGAELNPWTWAEGNAERQFQTRQLSWWGGARWWPWFVYSGWWIGGEARYSVYNLGGVLERSAEEGDAYGAGLYGGYAFMLGSHWNLDMGLGLWGGYKRYTRYACPLCGVITDSGGRGFVLPDARVALMFIF